MEIWKDVVGYEGIYEVSNKGKVRTHKNKTTYTEKHGVRKWEQRILKQKADKHNSKRVTLWKDGKGKDWLVHRLVALAFIEKPKGKDCINHIDGDRLNNHVENLEWCDHKENNNHAFDNGLMKSNNPIVIRDLETNELKYFRSYAKASEYLGYNPGYISGVLKKKKAIKGYEIYVKEETAQ